MSSEPWQARGLTYGWYWAVDALEAAGVNVHLAAPSRLSAFEGRRVKNREWRELVRYRAKLVALRSGLKAQVHAVIAKRGLRVPMTDLFGKGGRQLLDHLLTTDEWFHSAFGQRIESLLAASWCGLTPRHRESDTKVSRGRITKQGNRLVRWAAVEAAQKLRKDSWLHSQREALAERRNSRQIAKVATARKIVNLVFYGLRDGHIRCLEPRPDIKFTAA